jgi:hypothetical protein
VACRVPRLEICLFFVFTRKVFQPLVYSYHSSFRQIQNRPSLPAWKIKSVGTALQKWSLLVLPKGVIGAARDTGPVHAIWQGSM